MKFQFTCPEKRLHSLTKKGVQIMKIIFFFITKTRLFKHIENFTTKKTENFQKKKSDIFHISAQNIDCGYSLEPPRGGGSNQYPQSMI